SARRTASRLLQTLNVNCSCIAASGAPLVRSRVNAACSLASDPLGGQHSRSRRFPPPAPSQRRVRVSLFAYEEAIRLFGFIHASPSRGCRRGEACVRSFT